MSLSAVPDYQSSVPGAYTLVEEKEPLQRWPFILVQMQLLSVTSELISDAFSESLWIHTGLSFALPNEQYLNREKIHFFLS